MPKIAISYRRANSSAMAGRIFDRLTAHYGEGAVFMDIDSVPFGIDFRSQFRDTLVRTDVLLALIGANWIGVNAAGAARIQEETDPVRVEIETALERKTSIIPVLVDGAKMPNSTELPPEFDNFAFLNAAEVSSGRDFHYQMERLIGAIDRIVAPCASIEPPRSPSGRTQATVVDAEISARKLWRVDALRYFLVPLVLLLVAHYTVVNALDFNTKYLWLASVAVPFVFGFALFWASDRGTAPATAFAVALGVIAVAGMTLSESLNSGDPILPQTRFEWRDNIQFAGAIALSFIVGNVLARALHAVLGLKWGKT